MANTKKYVSFDKLSLYDEKIKKVINDGDAAAKAYADSLASNYDPAGSAATVQGKLDEEVIRAKAREDEIAGLVATAQGEVDALETYVGTIPADATATNVVAYVQEKTAGIATDENLQALTNRVTQAETDIDNIEKDYLKAADKTELSDAIAAEASRADAAEKVNAAAIKAISDDYLKASDKEALQAGIDANAEAIDAIEIPDVSGFATKDELAVVQQQSAKNEVKILQIDSQLFDITTQLENISNEYVTTEYIQQNYITTEQLEKTYVTTTELTETAEATKRYKNKSIFKHACNLSER